MTDMAIHINFKINYARSLALTLLLHLIVVAVVQGPETVANNFIKETPTRNPLKIHTLGIKRKTPTENTVYAGENKVQVLKQQRDGHFSKKLSFSDLKASPEQVRFPAKPVEQISRPGTLPKQTTAMNGIRFGNDELKKMAQESYSGNTQTFAGDKISLKYEVPDGKKLDELNEAELRLYGFLKRGAKNYATSIAAELHEFNLKYPHLQFPMTDTKQLMTGRLTYDEKGNLKQIKMVRWTNIDRLQGFFEEVLKRMEVMQNPPKELWSQNGEFTVFVTLQING